MENKFKIHTFRDSDFMVCLVSSNFIEIISTKYFRRNSLVCFAMKKIEKFKILDFCLRKIQTFGRFYKGSQIVKLSRICEILGDATVERDWEVSITLFFLLEFL